jgi:hypothetical protein
VLAGISSKVLRKIVFDAKDQIIATGAGWNNSLAAVENNNLVSTGC